MEVQSPGQEDPLVWGFSPEARRGSQGASRAAPGKSGLHARGEGQRRQWHPTPVLLPGKSHGRRRLVGCSPWSRYARTGIATGARAVGAGLAASTWKAESVSKRERGGERAAPWDTDQAPVGAMSCSFPASATSPQAQFTQLYNALCVLRVNVSL